MICTISLVVILAISIVLSVIAYNKCIEWVCLTSVVFIILSGVGVILALFMIVISHCAIDKTIAEYQMKHDSIVKEVEALEQDTDEKVSRVTVSKDVDEWNDDVYSQKYWVENLSMTCAIPA